MSTADAVEVNHLVHELDPFERNPVVLPARFQVVAGQADFAALDAFDRADVVAARPHDPHVLSNGRRMRHGPAPCVRKIKNL